MALKRKVSLSATGLIGFFFYFVLSVFFEFCYHPLPLSLFKLSCGVCSCLFLSDFCLDFLMLLKKNDLCTMYFSEKQAKAQIPSPFFPPSSPAKKCKTVKSE